MLSSREHRKGIVATVNLILFNSFKIFLVV